MALRGRRALSVRNARRAYSPVPEVSATTLITDTYKNNTFKETSRGNMTVNRDIASTCFQRMLMC